MRQIADITVTSRARAALRREFSKAHPRVCDATALVYVASYANPDGSTVEGFHPGYMVGPVSGGAFGEMWAVATLPGLPPLMFMPQGKWRAEDRYVVDLVGGKFALFSILPV